MADINDRRRELLYSLISLAGAGLLKIVWDQRNQGERLRVTHQAGSTQSGATSTFRVGEDDFTTWELSFDRPSRFQYSFEVLNGPPIDVILTDEPVHSQSGTQDWSYYPSASYLDAREATVVDLLPPDSDYRLVFDNSNRLEADPPTNLLSDPAVVRFQFDISPLEATDTDSTNGTATNATDGTATNATDGTATSTDNVTSTGTTNETTTTLPTGSDGNQN